MAYIGKEEVRKIRKDIKLHFGKNYKFSIRRIHYIKLEIVLISGPLSIDDKCMDITFFDGYEHRENKKLTSFVENLNSLISKTSPCKDRNSGNAFADCSDFNYFQNLAIGRWDKPFISTQSQI